MRSRHLRITWGRSDRIGAHYVLAIGCHLVAHVVIHPSMWAGSAHFFRKQIWLRPINYAALAGGDA